MARVNPIDPGHADAGGPIAAAHAWLRLVLSDRDFTAAWPLTDPELRRTLARAFLDARQPPPPQSTIDMLVDALASATRPDDAALAEWWDHFGETTLTAFAATWDYVDLERWGWLSWPRPVSPGLELAVIADAEPGAVLDEGPVTVRHIAFGMRYAPEDGWLVAASGLDLEDR